MSAEQTTRGVVTLDGAIAQASTPALDFCVRFLLAKEGALEGDHGETAGILRALRFRVDAERDARHGR